MLIEPGSQWPPPGHEKLVTRWQSWRAWWTGDPDELRKYAPLTCRGGIWERRAKKAGGREIHIPMAGDIARTSAEFVAGDTPAMEWEGDAAATLQAEWDTLSQSIGWANKLLECAEAASPMGGAFLRPAWDTSTADHPLLTIVPADQALPDFRFDMLHQVTFVRTLPAPAGWKAIKNGEVWRHLEHHESGQIRHELWLGDASNVGRPIPLEDHPQTRGLPGVINTTGVRPRGLLVEYVPNVLPNALVPEMPVGKSDLQGVETLLDALDEAWDSWMRDIRLGKGRILLSREMLDPVGAVKKGAAGGSGFLGGFFGGSRNTSPAAAFDVDAEAFAPLETPMETGSANGTTTTPITVVQFAIRFQEHEATVLGLIEQIASRSGWSPQSFGLHVDGQLSGTAMRRREHRSYRTRDRKRRYMRPSVERVAETLMLINAVQFRKAKPAKRPTLQWRETDQADPKENAEIIELLSRARAASREVLVKMAHPEWDDKQVAEEVARLVAEDAALTAPALDGTEPLEPAEPNPDEMLANGEITAEQANKFGQLTRSGVDPQEAARLSWGGRVKMIPGATPVTIKLDEDDPPAAPGVPPAAGPPKPAPFPPGR